MLSSYSVWLIDDNLPVHKIPDIPRREEIIGGLRPLDHDLLCGLIKTTTEDDWTDKDVFELCRRLVENTGKLKVFRHPNSALAHLEQEASQPDIIVYDIEYGQSVQDSDIALCKLLARSFTLAQVYTTYDVGIARLSLPKAFEVYFPKRLSEPENKRTCSPEKLAKLLSERSNQSFSTKMAKAVRKSASAALEQTLIGLDDLSPLAAIEAIVGNPEQTEQLNEQDFVDFVGNKVGEAFESDQVFRDKLKEYAKIVASIELSEAELSQAASKVMSLVVSGVRERIQHNDDILKLIRSAAKDAVRQRSQGKATAASSTGLSSLTRFTNFWLYAHPNDYIVRTGDIIEFLEPGQGEGSSRTLFFILTPPCDIEQFWKKTRGVLTFAVLERIQEGEASRLLKLYGNDRSAFKSTIKELEGASGPVLLPSLIVSEQDCWDYILFSHKIESRQFLDAERENWRRVLTYQVLSQCKRITSDFRMGARQPDGRMV